MIFINCCVQFLLASMMFTCQRKGESIRVALYVPHKHVCWGFHCSAFTTANLCLRAVKTEKQLQQPEFEMYKCWLNFRRGGSQEKMRLCGTVVRPCHLEVWPWRSGGCTGPPPRGQDSPASWWSQSSDWAGWRCLPPSWRTERARTSAGTADDERKCRNVHFYCLATSIFSSFRSSGVAARFITGFSLFSQYNIVLDKSHNEPLHS